MAYISHTLRAYLSTTVYLNIFELTSSSISCGDLMAIFKKWTGSI